MSEEKDVVEVMAEASWRFYKRSIPANGEIADWNDEMMGEHARKYERRRIQAALAALEAAGYTITRSTPGISHPQAPYRGEKE